jgi:hypothetical protein
MDKFRFYFVKIFCVTLNTQTEFIYTFICVSLKAGGGPLKLGSQGTTQFAAPFLFSLLRSKCTYRQADNTVANLKYS